MQATKILVEEHNIILKVLECTRKIITEAEANGKLNAEAATTGIDFFRNFADHCHHAKEEDRLFVKMEEHGFPRQGGPTGVMLNEHEMGRSFVGGMAEAVTDAAAGDREAIQRFAKNGDHFIELLTNHIAKENNILFPMADQSVGEAEMAKMLADFKQIEADAGGKRHTKYIDIARKLCEQYDVPFVDQSQIQTLVAELAVGV